MKNKGLLLDTHIWLWLAFGNDILSSSSCNLIKEAAAEKSIYISAISVWEVAMLATKGKIQLNQSCSSWIKQALAQAEITLLPLSPDIAVESCQLPGHVHGDPADRILIASARLENLTLMTRDERILAYADNQLVTVIRG